MDDKRKNPKSDLKKYYTVFLEIGLVVVLIIFVVAMKLDFRGSKNNIDLTKEQEVVNMKEVKRTQQKKTPPPPPEPKVPVEVPNDQVIKDQDLNLDSDLDLDEPLPEPPKQQSSGDKEEKIFVAVEQQPQMIGGRAALQKKLKYPKKCQRAGIEGRVTLQFVVNKDGSVQDVKVLRGIGGGCDQAAVNVIKKMKFKPGRQRGEPVRVKYSWPVTFRLQ